MPIIYKATNLVNQKVYIGKTTKTLAKRKHQHEYEALRATEPKGFHAAIKKHGTEKFEWSVLDDQCTIENLSEKEIFHIRSHNSYGSGGYNRTLGGDGASYGEPNVSKRPDVREKLRISSSKMKHSAETKILLREKNIGKRHSEVTKKKISIAGTGRTGTKGSKHSRAVSYKITTPDKTEMVITGMRQFCREHNLNAKLLRRVAKGFQEHHKGYFCSFV